MWCYKIHAPRLRALIEAIWDGRTLHPRDVRRVRQGRALGTAWLETAMAADVLTPDAAGCVS